jgi:PAS domain-containing protein
VIDPIFHTPARDATLRFLAPYVTATAVYADASLGGIHDLTNLKGFEVGVQAGDACAEELLRAGITGVRIYPSYQALIDAAASQSVKLLCMDQYSADYRLYRLGLQRQYVKAFEVARNDLRRAVRKGDTATLAMVEAGMAQHHARRDQGPARQVDGPELPSNRYTERLLEALLALGGWCCCWRSGWRSVRKAVRVRTAELEREKAQLRTLVESSPDVIWLKDPDGVYLSCNARFEELMGRPRQDIVGKRDDDFFAPEPAPSRCAIPMPRRSGAASRSPTNSG